MVNTSRWPVSRLPISNIQPFTYQDGETYLSLLNRLAEYITTQLHPNLRKTVEEMVEEMEHILAAQHGKYVEGVQDFQRIHDAFMEDVNSALTALNDSAVSDLVKDPGTHFGRTVRTILASSTGVVHAEIYPTFNEAVTTAHKQHRALVVDQDIYLDDDVDRDIFEVPIVGKGALIIDGNKFWVNPQYNGVQTNTLYINPSTGSDANSGISHLKPLRSFSRLNIVLKMLREKLLDGHWRVVIQAGTHRLTQGWRMDGLQFGNQLTITGEGDRDTILDGSQDAQGIAFYFNFFETKIRFENMVIRNYHGVRGTGTDSSAGILCQGPGQARIENIAFLDCATAVHLGYGVMGSVYGCTIRGSQPRTQNTTTNVGVSVLYGATVSVGSSGGRANTIENCGTGVNVSRNAVARVDYNFFRDNYFGFQAQHNTRVGVTGNVFERNIIGIGANGGSELTFTQDNTFGTGTLANVQYNIQMSGSARYQSHQGSGSAAVEYRLTSVAHEPYITVGEGTNRNNIVNFGSAAVIPAHHMVGEHKRLRMVLYGNALYAEGTRNFQLRKTDRDATKSQVLGQIVMLAGSTGSFRVEIEVVTTDTPGVFKYSSQVLSEGGQVRISHGTVSGINTDHQWIFRVDQTNSNGGDYIQLHRSEIYLMG